MAAISLENLTKVFNGLRAVNEIPFKQSFNCHYENLWWKEIFFLSFGKNRNLLK
jgi:hypothetical protein